MSRKFGDALNPLLVSIRSGARRSMPGMMETILNVGLTEKTIAGLIKQSKGNEKFVYDAYRRLIMMYSDVVMEKAAGIEPEDGKAYASNLIKFLKISKKKKYSSDANLTAEDLKNSVKFLKKK